MIVMNKFIADELANKVHQLNKALTQAQIIIDTLEKENKLLIDALNSLSLKDKEESWSKHSYAI